MAQGIVRQIVHHLLQPQPVPQHGRRCQLGTQFNVLFLRQQGQPGSTILHQRGQIQWLPLHLSAALQPGQVHQAAHQGGHSVALGHHGVQVLAPLGGVDVLPQGLGVGAEHRQRRFQFMGRRPGKGPLPPDGPGLQPGGEQRQRHRRPQGNQGRRLQTGQEIIAGQVIVVGHRMHAVGPQVRVSLSIVNGAGLFKHPPWIVRLNSVHLRRHVLVLLQPPLRPAPARQGGVAFQPYSLKGLRLPVGKELGVGISQHHLLFPKVQGEGPDIEYLPLLPAGQLNFVRANMIPRLAGPKAVVGVAVQNAGGCHLPLFGQGRVKEEIPELRRPIRLVHRALACQHLALSQLPSLLVVHPHKELPAVLLQGVAAVHGQHDGQAVPLPGLDLLSLRPGRDRKIGGPLGNGIGKLIPLTDDILPTPLVIDPEHGPHGHPPEEQGDQQRLGKASEKQPFILHISRPPSDTPP